MRTLLLLITWNCLLTVTALAQHNTVANNAGIKYYTTEDGLSQVSVNDIHKDKRGFLWLATQNGLNRFDGSKFIVYTNEKEKAESIVGNYVNCIFEDMRGYIWVGTDNNGLCYWNPEKNQFFQPDFDGIKQAASVTSISQDRNGNIWFVLKDKGVGCILFIGKYIKEIVFEPFETSDPTTLHINSDNTVFVGTKEGLIWTATSTYTSQIKFEKEVYQLTGSITCINSRGTENIWVGTREKLYRANTTSKNVEQVYLNNSTSDSKRNTIIYDISWDKHQNCWIATGNGLYKLLNSGSIQRYGSEDVSRFKLSNNTVYCVQPDDDLVWVGTGKYMNLLIQKPFFNTINISSQSNKGTGSNIVFSITKTSKGLWVGTSDEGLVFINNEGSYHYTSKHTGLPDSPVFSLQRDTLNNLWVGTKSGIAVIDLNSFNADNPKFIAIRNIPNDTSSLSNNFVRQIYSDNGGNVWVCTQHGGLNRFIGNVKQHELTFQQFRQNTDSKNRHLSEKIYTIIQDKYDRYWLGTSLGLCRLTFENNDFASPVFKSFYINDDVVNDNTVYCILEDEEGILWLGSRSGLSRFDAKSEEFIHYNLESGLPDNVIYSIVQDENKDIWVSTNKGLACFDKQNQTFRSYDVSDGLPTAEFNLNAVYKDELNKLYFGSINGISFFNPKELSALDKETKIVFTDISFEDNKRKTVAKQKKLSTTNQLILNDDNFPLNIGFTNIDVRPFKNINFAYRILPNEKWNYIQKRRNIQFHHLAPGKYTLEIQGQSRGQFWEKPPLKLHILVKPPWWKSHVAIFVWLLLFCTLTYLIYKRHLQNILTRKEAEKLKEIDKIKTQFFTNISHEFRTPLAIINGLTKKIEDKLSDKDREQHSKDFAIIDRNGNHLLNLINQMLDLSKLEDNSLKLQYFQSDIISYLSYLCESYSTFASTQNIQFTFYKEIDTLLMDFDPEQLKTIVANLLSNAIKYTPEGGSIIFHASYNKKDKLFTFKVKDTGEGIPKEVLTKIFERFYQNPTSSNQHAGTGIGLSLINELVELMGGQINVKSKIGKGSEFTVQLPVYNNAVISEKVSMESISNDAIHTKYPKHDEVLNNPKPDQQQSMPLVLLIEDNADVAYYIESCLAGLYHMVWCNNGNDGVSSAQELVPDIVISDIMMPQKDGYQVCAELKNNERTDHIPIVLLTAKSGQENRLAGIASGADLYLEKPFDKAELLLQLEQIIKTRQKLQVKYKKNQSTENDNTEDPFLKKATEVINQHMHHPKFNAMALAFELKYSESQLYRKIKALSGTSTALFIRSVRLQKAKELLLSSEMNIAQIAYETGFNDPAWFSRSFKEEFGYSPKELKNK